MEALKILIRKRENVKHKLTNFITYLSDIQSNASPSKAQLTDLELRVTRLDNILMEFEEIQTKIEVTVKDADLPNQYAVRTGFENEYFETLSKAKIILSENNYANDKVLIQKRV
jgi:hypothetical protein